MPSALIPIRFIAGVSRAGNLQPARQGLLCPGPAPGGLGANTMDPVESSAQ
jgi:hypothetical protein